MHIVKLRMAVMLAVASTLLALTDALQGRSLLTGDECDLCLENGGTPWSCPCE